MHLRDVIIPGTQGRAAELVTQDQKNWLLLREPREDGRAGQEEVRGWGSSHWDPNQWPRSAFHTHAELRHHRKVPFSKFASQRNTRKPVRV